MTGPFDRQGYVVLDRPYAFKQWVEKYIDTIPGGRLGCQGGAAAWRVGGSVIARLGARHGCQATRPARAPQLPAGSCRLFASPHGPLPCPSCPPRPQKTTFGWARWVLRCGLDKDALELQPLCLPACSWFSAGLHPLRLAVLLARLHSGAPAP